MQGGAAAPPLTHDARADANNVANGQRRWGDERQERAERDVPGTRHSGGERRHDLGLDDVAGDGRWPQVGHADGDCNVTAVCRRALCTNGSLGGGSQAVRNGVNGLLVCKRCTVGAAAAVGGNGVRQEKGGPGHLGAARAASAWCVWAQRLCQCSAKHPPPHSRLPERPPRPPAAASAASRCPCAHVSSSSCTRAHAAQPSPAAASRVRAERSCGARPQVAPPTSRAPQRNAPTTCELETDTQQQRERPDRPRAPHLVGCVAALWRPPGLREPHAVGCALRHKLRTHARKHTQRGAGGRLHGAGAGTAALRSRGRQRKRRGATNVRACCSSLFTRRGGGAWPPTPPPKPSRHPPRAAAAPAAGAAARPTHPSAAPTPPRPHSSGPATPRSRHQTTPNAARCTWGWWQRCQSSRGGERAGKHARAAPPA